MDLIYADEARKDIGVLNEYSLDMAFGKDENNFECVVDRESHCCKDGYFIYAEGEEYGGIVDEIKVDTQKDEITYIGRTWHGILASKVICPDTGQDYAVFDGDANAVLDQIIDRLSLNSLFTASSEVSGIDINAYQMDRYIPGYEGITKMLKAFDTKLHIRWWGGMVELSAVPRYDYSQDEEFDTSQVDFIIRRNFKPINHVICLGQGNLRERAVIHIFTDENGGIQPFSKTDEPLQDSDYILDTSKQILFQENEVAEVLDYPNAEITENYVKLTEKPVDWESNCEAYFEQDSDSFKSVEREDTTVYTLQKLAPYDWATGYNSYFQKSGSEYTEVSGTTTYELQLSQPSDWSAKYDKYFIKSGSNYKAVEGAVSESYIKQKSKPSDWSKNYKNYYVFYSDGVNSEYKSVDGVTKYRYTVQTRQPTDWNDSYTNYYKKAKKGGYENIPKPKDNKAPKWKAKTYYTKSSYQVAPAWDDTTRYTYKKTVSAPKWVSNLYYTEIASSAPVWSGNKYYTQTQERLVPKWTANKYYKMLADRYAVMVSEAIERLNEAHAADDLSIDLEETEQVYDVGDFVGAIEQITGIVSVQEVVKKIIKIKNGEITLNYEVN